MTVDRHMSDTTTTRPTRPTRRPHDRPPTTSIRQTTEPAELVIRARAGDQRAWDEIVRRHTNMVEHVIRSSGLSPALVDDATQSTWIRLANSLDRINDPRCLSGWLRSTARNEAINLIRKEWRLVPSDRLDEIVDHDDVPFDPSDASELGAVIESALASLSDRQRALVELRYLQAEIEPYADIAEQLEMRPGSIGPTLGRAMQRLRRHPEIVRIRAA
ncbi:MAG: sigma-70 family RNA polymerase sigma factor [Actinomycetota bacterium]